MKNTKRMLAMVVVLVFIFTLAMTSGVFAGAGNGKDGGKAPSTDTEKVKGSEKVSDSKVEVKDKEKAEAEKDSTAETEEEKTVKEKDKVMEQKKLLTKQLIEAQKSGNTEVAAALQAQIKEYKEQLKKMVMESYTAEETAKLQAEAQLIEAVDPTVDVLPIDSVIAKDKSLKLDMPPVVKDGKVLVPVRAFSQAYGAEVKWNGEEHTITIVKEGVEIVLKVDSSIVLVNGVETDLGLPVKGINGRNVIPVGFLAEKLGLKAETDPEDGTIEIEEEDDTTAETGTETNTDANNSVPTPTPTPAPAGTAGN